jgi:hypothetical protein
MYRIILIICAALACSYVSNAQGKYIQVKNSRIYFADAYAGKGCIPLTYKSADKKKLQQYVLKYAKQPQFVIKSNEDDKITIRSFFSFCTNEKDSCLTPGGLVSTTWLTIKILDERLEVTFNYQLYSNYFNAELLINNNDDVASKNDAPFNTYLIKQLYEVGSYQNLAYTDCVYDYNGNIINYKIKKAIEDFYDGIIDHLHNFINAEYKK